jgi:ribosomal protein L32
MAVPKKKTSKSKTKARKATWKNKAAFAVSKALTLAKSVFNKTGLCGPLWAAPNTSRGLIMVPPTARLIVFEKLNA